MCNHFGVYLTSESDHYQPSYVVSPIFFSWIHPSIKDNLYWATSYLLQSTSPLLSQVILSQQRKSKVNHFLGKNIALHFGCLKYHPVMMASSHLKSMSCYMFGTWLLWYVFFSFNILPIPDRCENTFLKMLVRRKDERKAREQNGFVEINIHKGERTKGSSLSQHVLVKSD